MAKYQVPGVRLSTTKLVEPGLVHIDDVRQIRRILAVVDMVAGRFGPGPLTGGAVHEARHAGGSCVTSIENAASVALVLPSLTVIRSGGSCRHSRRWACPRAACRRIKVGPAGLVLDREAERRSARRRVAVGRKL